MIYTIKMKLDSDGYTPENESDVIEFINKAFNKTAVFISDVVILDAKETIR